MVRIDYVTVDDFMIEFLLVVLDPFEILDLLEQALKARLSTGSIAVTAELDDLRHKLKMKEYHLSNIEVKHSQEMKCTSFTKSV